MTSTSRSQSDKKGPDDAGRLGAVVSSSLASAGLPRDVVDKYALLVVEVYRYLLEHPAALEAVKGVKDAHEVYDGTKKAFTAAGYVERAGAIGLSSAQSGFSAYGASGGAGVLQVFRERFEAFAKSQGIELDECSMAVSRLSLDIAAAGIGSVTALTGFGAVMAAVGVLGTFKDGYAVGQLCILRSDR